MRGAKQNIGLQNIHTHLFPSGWGRTRSTARGFGDGVTEVKLAGYSAGAREPNGLPLKAGAEAVG